MNRHPHRARWLSVIAALGCAAADASAQHRSRIAFGGDSLARLTAHLPPKSRALVDGYLTGSDSAAREAVRTLRYDSTAAEFILAALPKEPVDSIRFSMLSTIRTSDFWMSSPNTTRVLRERIENDPSIVAVEYAIEALRSIALRQSALRSAFAARMAKAKAANDTAIVRLVRDYDDDQAHLEGWTVFVPKFVRTPPPVFNVADRNQSIRVLAFGDYGFAHQSSERQMAQGALAQTMREYHGSHPFTFGITLGDNFYPAGAASPTVSSWRLAWEDMYAPLGVPFYVALGNHDWYDEASPVAEYVYGMTSKSWKLPALYYTYTAGPAQFFVVNTNVITARQLAWLEQELSRSTATWKIVYGHYPIYEQTDYSVAVPRATLMPLLQKYGVQMYLAGHAHSLQHWQVDGIDYVVSGGGSGAKTTYKSEVPDSRRRFGPATPGFAVLDVGDQSLTLRFIGEHGTERYKYTRTK
jgi:tartrate-resistant acid phosphatase type 5